MRNQLYINNEWLSARSGRTLDVVNPATEEVITSVPAAEQADLELAVEAARAALSGPWSQLSPRERGRFVWNIGERLLDTADEVARLETLHNGKPITESRHIDIPAAAACFQYYAGWADKIHGETIPVDNNYLAYTLREPVGIVAAIVPWNFPLLLAAWKVAPALACGNTVILKPASQTPLTALALAQIASDVGLPPGVLNVVTGTGTTLGRLIVAHPGIDKIAFTGDTSTGREIMRNSADTLKRITLELGGKSPNIVLPMRISTPPSAVRPRASSTARARSARPVRGCSSIESIRDQFLEKVVARAKKMLPGDPMDPKTRPGAIASKTQLLRDLKYIETAKQEGATLLAGGGRHDIGTGKGYFLEPTVFGGVTPAMTIAREEIFGPVLAAIEFADLDEAIARANDSPYGLAAAVWTKDIKKAHHVARKLQAGTVWVNSYNVYDTAVPFGGYKQSGFGREMSVHALEHYTQLKSVWVDLT